MGIGCLKSDKLVGNIQTTSFHWLVRVIDTYSYSLLLLTR